MMSTSRTAQLLATPAYQTAMKNLDKLLQDTGSSVECILSSYTASSAETSGPEAVDVRTSLSMGISPTMYTSRREAQTNIYYKDNLSVSSLGPTQFQASASNIAQCLDVQSWYSQKHSSHSSHEKSLNALASTNDECSFSYEDALRGLLEEVKKTVGNWLLRHKTILQDRPSRCAVHDGVAVSPGLYLPNGASPVVFEREQSPAMCMGSLGGNTSGDEGLRVHQNQKEEEKRRADVHSKQNGGGKRGDSVQQNQKEENRDGLFLQQSVFLDKVVDDIACQLQSDEQPTTVHLQDLPGREPAACLSPQGSNAQVDTLSTEVNVAATAANTGSTPLLKENELTPTNIDQTEVKLPITKWTPPTSGVKTVNKSLSFPRAVEVITSPDWLPEGWVTELKTRGSGNSAGSKDKYYVDPVSHRRFRSRKEVIAYLERGKTKSSDDSPETSPVKKFPAPELLPTLPNKSNKKAKPKESGTLGASAMPPPMVPSPGLLSNVFMPPYRTGQPSEWLVYESLASLPFPMFDPFYYKDFTSSKSSSSKGSHVPTRPWFFTGPEASWNPFMDRSSLGKSGDKGKDYQSYFSMPSYPSEVGPKPSAGGVKKSSKRKSVGL